MALEGSKAATQPHATKVAAPVLPPKGRAPGPGPLHHYGPPLCGSGQGDVHSPLGLRLDEAQEGWAEHWQHGGTTARLWPHRPDICDRACEHLTPYHVISFNLSYEQPQPKSQSHCCPKPHLRPTLGSLLFSEVSRAHVPRSQASHSPVKALNEGEEEVASH